MAIKNPLDPMESPRRQQPKQQWQTNTWEGGYETPEAMKGFQDWYGKQQGGNRPEDMERFLQPETLKRWDPYLERGGAQAGKYRSSRGAEGYFDKPTECPPGMVPSGPSETDPCVPASGGGPGGGGGGGGGYGYGGEGGDLALYQLKKVYADALRDPSGEQAWKLFAGQGGATSFQNTIDQMRKKIAGMPAGPARDAAAQRIAEMEANMRIQMPQQATQVALSGLTGVMQPEIGYVGSERDRALQRSLGFAGLDLQRELGMGGLGLQREAQGFAQGPQFQEMIRQFNENQGLQKWLAEQQGKQATKTGFLGTLGQLGGALIGTLSDARVKENIAPGRRGLSDIIKLRTYKYNYKFDPKKTPQQGVMAQDLEKVAPEFVHDIGGLKAVDSYGLLSMSIEAIKELAEKMEKREKN